MHVLTVVTPDGEKLVGCAEAGTVLDQLAAAGIDMAVPSGCGGSGACGLCRVRVDGGAVEPPTPAEAQRLSDIDLHNGWRLACQLRLAGDARIAVAGRQAGPRWTRLAGLTRPPRRRQGGRVAAVDLGSTRIRVSVCDLGRGVRLGAVVGSNPQARHGSDILTRLAAAMDPAAAEALRTQAITAVAEALARIGAKDISAVTVVGNTAMLALLSGRGGSALLDPENWGRFVPVQPAQPPFADARLADPLSGFIGSDLLAAVLAGGLQRHPPGSLLIDFGTNTEVALWDGGRLWVTAAAGGPAFEGWGLSCGMPAEPGAICALGDDGAAKVIGGGPGRGLCASGMVDLAATLLRTGAVDALGRFATRPGAEGLAVSAAHPLVRLKRGDLDGFQRAKAAVGAAVQCLAAQAGIGRIDRVTVTGAFGQWLDAANAQAIGLLPAAQRIELKRDLALLGAERLAARTDAVDALRREARPVNLSDLPGYEDRFIANLRLAPLTT